MDKINILINNAGVVAFQHLEFTKDGHEINHLSHFLFFELLKPGLLAATTPEFNSRIVILSPTAHLLNSFNDSDNYNDQKGGYSSWGAYAQSKTADLYMASELERRYGPEGLHATSVHPGGIMTGLSQHLPDSEVEAFKGDGNLMKYLKSPEQGAATTVWAAVGKGWRARAAGIWRTA
ncbi:hypothetical protein N0V84_011622 [Fusarium piperis]|uniref:Uncharacterized protein n=1 Tax=Fusarium piperis TaxID=1435070 RepID=A0A9W8TBL9_9HYPO|nr:hypothetical protein N0V84_011622 [Fusarium piperis]